MNPKIVIRTESAADANQIAEVTVAAFETLAISKHTEQFIIEALRAAGALTLSLVAELDGRVIGHIAFTPVVMSDRTPGWYGLGPVSPPYQRQGVGTALIGGPVTAAGYECAGLLSHWTSGVLQTIRLSERRGSGA